MGIFPLRSSAPSGTAFATEWQGAASSHGGYLKTRLEILSFLLTLAVAVGMISWGSALNAQDTPSSPAAPQTQQPSTPPSQQPQTQPTPSPEVPPAQQPPAAQTPAMPPDASASEPGAKPSSPSGPSAASGATDSQTFTGTVEKQGDKYVLKDESGKIYDIDHQDDVKKFEGKKVHVQGTLDPSGKKILVK